MDMNGASSELYRQDVFHVHIQQDIQQDLLSSTEQHYYQNLLLAQNHAGCQEQVSRRGSVLSILCLHALTLKSTKESQSRFKVTRVSIRGKSILTKSALKEGVPGLGSGIAPLCKLHLSQDQRQGEIYQAGNTDHQGLFMGKEKPFANSVLVVLRLTSITFQKDKS